MRTALPLRPSLQSLPPCTGASELHLHPARAIGSRVTTRSCVVCARTRNVVRRSLGDHSSTRARTRGACSPDSPEKDTAIFSSRSVESSSPPCPHATQPVRLLPYWDMSAIYLCCPRHPTRVLRSPQARIAVAHQHASSGRRAARPALRERRRSPRAGPLWDRRRGRESADPAPQGQRGRF